MNLKELIELILKRVIIPDDVIENSEIINNLSSISDVNKYRYIINLLEYRQKSYHIEAIEEKRKLYYEDIFNTYNFKTKMFLKYENIYNYLMDNLKSEKQIDAYELNTSDYFKDLSESLKHDILVIFYNLKKDLNTKIKDLEKLFSDISINEYLNYFVDYSFRDLPYNFFLNLEQVVKFNEERNFIGDNIMLYKKILDCYKNNYLDVNFFGFFKNKNFVQSFYDDYRKCKDISYNMLNDSLYKFDKNQLNTILSEKYNCDIYDFNGETFYLLIHNTGIKKNSDIDSVFNSSSFDSTSLSLISDKRLKYYNDFKDTVILGFNNIDINNIIHVYESDSYSSSKNDEEKLATNRVNKLYFPSNLIKETRGYNEIVYQCKQNNVNESNLTNFLNPSYIVCFNKKITDLDINLSKKFNIPIININIKMYKNMYKKTVIDILKQDDSYINSYQKLKK